MMVGRDLSSLLQEGARSARQARAPVILEVDGITDGGGGSSAARFHLHAGRGARASPGLVGAGRTELARLIYGADPRPAGEVELEGKPVDIRTPSEALDAGIAYLTEDRKALGLFLDMSCGDNINLGVIGRDARLGGVLNRDKARDARQQARSRRSASARRAPRSRSAACPAATSRRCCCRAGSRSAPKVLILDEPTRGVDIGAKSEIYRIIDELAQGAASAIIVISSELPEIIGICDRVLVMREGHIEGEVGGPRRHADHPGKHHGARHRRGGRARCTTGTAGRHGTTRPRRRGLGSRAARLSAPAGADAQHDPGGRHAAGADASCASASTTCPTAASSRAQNISIVAAAGRRSTPCSPPA